VPQHETELCVMHIYLDPPLSAGKELYSLNTKFHINLKIKACVTRHILSYYPFTNWRYLIVLITVEPGYNDMGLYDTSSIAPDDLRYQLIPHY
jgi:hypothetical protein